MGHSSSKIPPAPATDTRTATESKSLSRGEFILVNNEGKRQINTRDRRVLLSRNGYLYAHKNLYNSISMPYMNDHDPFDSPGTNDRSRELDGFERINRRGSIHDIKHGYSLGNGLNEIKEEEEQQQKNQLTCDTRRHSMYELLDDNDNGSFIINAVYNDERHYTPKMRGGMYTRNSAIRQDSLGCKSAAPTSVSEDSAISLRHDNADNGSSTAPSSSTSENGDHGSTQRLSHTDSEASRFSAFLPESTSSSIKGANINNDKKASLHIKAESDTHNDSTLKSTRRESQTNSCLYTDEASSLWSITSLEESADPGQTSRSSTLRNRSTQQDKVAVQMQKSHKAGDEVRKEKRVSCDSSSSATISNVPPLSAEQDNSFDTDDSDISSISCSKRALKSHKYPRKIEMKIGDAKSNFTTVLIFESSDESRSNVLNKHHHPAPPVYKWKETEIRSAYKETNDTSPTAMGIQNGGTTLHPSKDSHQSYMPVMDAASQLQRYLDEQDALKLWSNVPAPPTDTAESVNASDVKADRHDTIRPYQCTNNKFTNQISDMIKKRSIASVDNDNIKNVHLATSGSVNKPVKNNPKIILKGDAYGNDFKQRITDNVSDCYKVPINNVLRNSNTTIVETSKIVETSVVPDKNAPIFSVPMVIEAKKYSPQSEKTDSIPAYGYQLDYGAYNKALRQHINIFKDVLRDVDGLDVTDKNIKTNNNVPKSVFSAKTSATGVNTTKLSLHSNLEKPVSKGDPPKRSVSNVEINRSGSNIGTKRPVSGVETRKLVSKFDTNAPIFIKDKPAKNTEQVETVYKTASKIRELQDILMKQANPFSLISPSRMPPSNIQVTSPIDMFNNKIREITPMNVNGVPAEVAPPHSVVVEKKPSIIYHKKAKHVKNKIEPCDVNERLTEKNNGNVLHSAEHESSDIPMRLKISDIKSMLEKAANVTSGHNRNDRVWPTNCAGVKVVSSGLDKYKQHLSNDNIVLVEGNKSNR